MWIPNRLLGLLDVNAETLRTLQTDLAAVRAERDLLKVQLVVAQSNFEWTRTRVNALEYERAALLEKASGVKVPVPSIERATPPVKIPEALFEDVGDEMASKLGLPIWDKN